MDSETRDRWLEAMRRAALHYPGTLPPRTFVRHERIVGAVLYGLAIACFAASLVAFTRSEWPWSFVFGIAFTVLIGCAWNIEDRRLSG